MAGCTGGVDSVVVVEGVRHWYGRLLALDGVSLAVGRGEFIVVAGPNGSGKTSLLRAILGFIRPRQGRVCVLGHDPARLPREKRARIGYAPERDSLPGWLTVREYLEIVEEHYGRSDWGVVDLLGLGRVLDRSIASLSQGYRKRVQLAAALMPRPELLVLDEPYTSIDIETRLTIDAALERIRGSTTILLATHIEPTTGYDRLIVMYSGRIVAELQGEQLKPHYIIECGSTRVVTASPAEAADYVRKGCRLAGCEPPTIAGILSKILGGRRV